MTNQELINRAKTAVAWIPGDQGLWKEMIEALEMAEDTIKRVYADNERRRPHSKAANELLELRIAELSPLEAITKLYELQRMAQGEVTHG